MNKYHSKAVRKGYIEDLIKLYGNSDVRYANRRDSNEHEIVEAIEAIGASHVDASRVGGNFPDQILGIYGLNFIYEIKPVGIDLRKSQQEWHEAWKGQVGIFRTADDVFNFRKELLYELQQCKQCRCSVPRRTKERENAVA